jgi:hypothetical protein
MLRELLVDVLRLEGQALPATLKVATPCSHARSSLLSQSIDWARRFLRNVGKWRRTTRRHIPEGTSINAELCYVPSELVDVASLISGMSWVMTSARTEFLVVFFRLVTQILRLG